MMSTGRADGQYLLMNLHSGTIAFLLVICSSRKYKNEEFIFYCLLFIGEETTKLDIIRETKGQMHQGGTGIKIPAPGSVS